MECSDAPKQEMRMLRCIKTRDNTDHLKVQITHGDPHCRLQGHGQRQACEIENHRHGDMKTEEGGSDAMYGT